MVNYKLQEEDKERRAEAERIMVENQKKIEEQQRKMVSEIFYFIYIGSKVFRIYFLTFYLVNLADF